MRPAKTQISMGIRPVWSESLLPTWRKLGSLTTQRAHSEDSDQTGRVPRLIWVFAGRTVILLVLSWGSSSWLNGTPEAYQTACMFTEWRQLLHLVELALIKAAIPTLDWLWKMYEYVWAWPWENVSYVICEQQRRRSACASTQSDQHLCCSLSR